MPTLSELITQRNVLFATAAALTSVHQTCMCEGASQGSPLRALTSLNAAQAAHREYLVVASQVAALGGRNE